MHLIRDIFSAFRPSADRAYDTAQQALDAERSRVMLAYVGFVYPIFYGLDLFVYPECWREFGAIRAVLCLFALTVLTLGGRLIPETMVHRAAIVASIAATFGVALMCALSEGFGSLYIVGMILCYMAIATIEIYRPAQLLLVLLALSLAYFALNALVPSETDARKAAAAAFFVGGAVLFCAISSALLEKNRRELFAVNSLIMRQNADLERAHKHQGQFLSTVSHELRSPVNSVLGFAELIEQRESALHDKSRANLRRIRESGQRLLRFINDLLDLSKAEAGRMEIHLCRFDLMAVVQEVAEATRALVLHRSVSVEVVGPSELFIRSDELRVRQILTNLASNAAKFTERGRITISILVTQGVSLEVADTGAGIPEESREAIFEAFRQAGVSAGGTGLGLSIVDHLVTLLGGTIELDSELGKGSTFRVHLGQIAVGAAAA
jgi:signal transduction histidine kinase